MTTSQDPNQAEVDENLLEEPAPEASPRQRPERSPRRRQEQNPALDPRLAQLERRSRPNSRASDVSLMVIGIVAFVFGVAMHYWVATSVLGSDDGGTDVVAEATATPPTQPNATITPTVQAQATATPLPDRTSCDEIRGTQYRSVSEREFFLANCTGQQPAPTQAAPATTPTQ